MIQKLAQRIFASYNNRVERFINAPIKTQQRTFDYLIKHGRNTYFGQEHGFDSIQDEEAFQKNIPIFSYEDLRPYLDKIVVEKKQNILWDTPVKWFSMSSGTTEEKSKYIPVTHESLYKCHYRCGYHMLGMYCSHYPDAAFMLGKSLVLGGSQQFNTIGEGIYTGDISAILIKNLPLFAKWSRTPEHIALLTDWEEKLRRLTDYAIGADIRALVGVPSWLLVLLKKIVEETGKSLTEIWPHIEVFFHGGVSFTPFIEQYNKLIPKDSMRYWETYNASEGFFGIQYSPKSKEMLLLLDNEIYYEFLPEEEWNKEQPQAVPLSAVEIGKQYALIISTSGGLWRYQLGDTIEFTSTSPHLFIITGRTKQFMNAFGEEVIVDNADKALSEACRKTGAKITEYTAAPIYFGDNHNGAHEWLIEFETEPNNIKLFIETLDEALKNLNSDYEAKRSYDLSLGKPMVRVLQKGTFYNWMKHRKKLGGQNKIPKLANNRKYVESILDFLATNS